MFVTKTIHLSVSLFFSPPPLFLHPTLEITSFLTCSTCFIDRHTHTRYSRADRTQGPAVPHPPPAALLAVTHLN